MEFWSEKRGRPKHVYLMDMNELYLVVVRLPGWGFMAEASHINARKAVPGDKAVGTLIPVRQLSMQDHENYTVAEGAPVRDILKGMLGPRCDENRDAFHKLALKLQDLEDNDSAKKEMKVEIWTFKGDRTTWVNTTSVFKYIYTGARDNFSRMQKSHFQNTNIPHKLLEVPGVRTIFFI